MLKLVHPAPNACIHSFRHVACHPTKSGAIDNRNCIFDVCFHFHDTVWTAVTRSSLRCLHSKKSGWVRSGDLGGHKPREYNPFPKGCRSNASHAAGDPVLLHCEFLSWGSCKGMNCMRMSWWRYSKNIGSMTATRNRTPRGHFRRVQRCLIMCEWLIRTS